MTKPTIIGKECRFAVHIPASRSKDTPDVHMVKEQIHYSDGTVRPNVRLIKNFNRNFYVTTKPYRNHKQKKESEHIDRLMEYTCTQSELRDRIAQVLETPWSKDPIKKLNRSPYVYGADISSTALLKHRYHTQYPNLKTRYTVSVLDIETDVINGTKEAIMCTVVFENKCYTAVLKSFVQGIASVEDMVERTTRKYIGEYLDKYQMTTELYIAKDVVDLIRQSFMKLHEWKPDFVAIWNINFDIPEMIKMLEQYQIPLEDVFCDPSIPKPLRICKYIQGPNKKRTASGKVSAIPPEQQWHYLLCTASFFVIDAMCSYKYIRLAKQKEQSYSLDSILDKELGIRKLKFKEADGYTGLQWHQFMQRSYKLEYIAYNRFDCISMIELDEKTKDLGFTLPTYAGFSDFSIFNSQPKRISVAYYLYLLDHQHILGTVGAMESDDEKAKHAKELIDEETTGDEEEDLESGEILSLKDWISTLAAHLVIGGLACIEEDPNIRTNIRTYVQDSDKLCPFK